MPRKSQINEYSDSLLLPNLMQVAISHYQTLKVVAEHLR